MKKIPNAHAFGIFYVSVTHSQTEHQDQTGQQDVCHLEFSAPFKPVSVAHIRQFQRDQQRRIGGVEHIGETVAKGKGNYAQPGGNAGISEEK